MAKFTKENAAIYAKRGMIARWAPKAAVAAIALEHGLNGIEAESRHVKGCLSKELLHQVSLLEITPCRTLASLKNTPSGEGRASLVARIADTAAKIYGWDNEKGNALVIIGLVGSLDPDNQVQSSTGAIDVESTPG